MTEKEKAKELIDKFAPYCNFKSHYDDSIDMDMRLRYAKQCALIAVDLVLDNLEDHTGEDIKYWQEVKQEIENL
jgi:hypothetical protein